MLLTAQTKIAIAITLLLVWFYHNWHYVHQQPPLITNVIKSQNNHRNIMRPWDHFDMVRNLRAKQKIQAEK